MAIGDVNQADNLFLDDERYNKDKGELQHTPQLSPMFSSFVDNFLHFRWLWSNPETDPKPPTCTDEEGCAKQKGAVTDREISLQQKSKVTVVSEPSLQASFSTQSLWYDRHAPTTTPVLYQTQVVSRLKIDGAISGERESIYWQTRDNTRTIRPELRLLSEDRHRVKRDLTRRAVDCEPSARNCSRVVSQVNLSIVNASTETSSTYRPSLLPLTVPPATWVDEFSGVRKSTAPNYSENSAANVYETRSMYLQYQDVSTASNAPNSNTLPSDVGSESWTAVDTTRRPRKARAEYSAELPVTSLSWQAAGSSLPLYVQAGGASVFPSPLYASWSIGVPLVTFPSAGLPTEGSSLLRRLSSSGVSTVGSSESVPELQHQFPSIRNVMHHDSFIPSSSVSPSTGVASSSTTKVTLVQHLTTNIDCTNCMFQFQIFQTQPVKTEAKCTSEKVMTSTVTQKTLTIMMPSSSTSIDCTNCAFQYQMFTTRPVQLRTECASSVCGAGSMVRKLSTIVTSPSQSSSQTWPSATLSSILPTLCTKTSSTIFTEHPAAVPPVAPQLESSVSSIEPSYVSSKSRTHTLHRQSDPYCDHIPTYYYEDPARRDALVAWLEAVLLYFKEIRSMKPTVFLEQLEAKPEYREETSLTVIHKLMEDTRRIVREIIINIFQNLQISDLNLILESEKFRMRMRMHLGYLKSFPDELKVKLDEVKNLIVLGEKKMTLILLCLGEHDRDTEIETKVPAVPSVSHEINTVAEKTIAPRDTSTTGRSATARTPVGFGVVTLPSQSVSTADKGAKTHDYKKSTKKTSTSLAGPTCVVTDVSYTLITYDCSSSSTNATTVPITSMTQVDWPKVLHINATASLTPRVLTDDSAAVTRTRVMQDYGIHTLTPDAKPESPRETVSASPTHTTSHPRTGSWVLGRVAGHKLQDFVHRSSAHLPTRRGAPHFILTNMARLNNVTFILGLWAQQVQGIDMGRLLRHGVSLHASSIRAHFTFSRPVQVDGPVTASSINGEFATAFITLGGHHVLPQQFTFTGSVAATAHVRVRSELNDLDFALLSKSVVLTSPEARQVLLQPVSFTRVSGPSLVFGNARVGEVSLEDLVQLGSPAIITGAKIFKELTVWAGDTRAAALTAHYISGVNVTDFLKNSLTMNPGGMQIILGPVLFTGLQVLGNLTTSRGLNDLSSSGAHSIRIDRLAALVLCRDEDAKLKGNLLLMGSVAVRDIIFRNTFDSVPSAAYNSGWLMKTSPQSLGGRVSLARVKAAAVTVAPGVKVQNVDLSRLLEATAKVNENVVMSSSVRLTTVLAARVWVGGAVQGWDLSSEAILQNSSDVIFTSPKTFMDAFHVSGTLTAPILGGAAAFKPCYENRWKNLVVIGAVRMTSPVTIGVVHLGQHILKRDTMDNYWQLNSSAILLNPMSFGEVIAKHIEVGSINGVDIAKRSNVLRRTCRSGAPQVVSGSFSAPLLVVQSLLTPSIATIQLNQHPVSHLENIFTRDGRQTIHGQWRLQRVHAIASVFTSGGVNGVLVTDFCVFSKPCTITALKTFARDLAIKGDMLVQPGKTVQGVDVSELRRVVTATACDHVPGLTTFTGSLSVSLLVAQGLVDGVKVTSKDLLTRSGAQIMTGQLSVISKEGAVAAPSMSALDGLFNSWNLSDRWHRAFSRNQDNIVREMVVFNGPVTFRNATGQLGDLANMKALPHQIVHYLHDLSLDATRAISGVTRDLWGWRSVQTFQGPAAWVVYLKMRSGSTGAPSSCPRYVVVISQKGEARLLIYSDDRKKYINTGVVLEGGCTKAVAGYRLGSEDHVVTAHTCTDDNDYTSYTTSPVPEGGMEAVQVWRLTTYGPQLLHRIATGASDVQVVEVGKRVCLVVSAAHSNATFVYCLDVSRGTFSEPQLLTTGCSRKTSVVQHLDSRGRLVNLLAVVGQDEHTRHDALSLWQHDVEQNNFLLVQRKDLRGVRWVHMTSHGPDIFLAVVTRGFRGDTMGRIIIYRVNLNGDGVHPSTSYFGPPLHTAPSAAPEKLYSSRYHPQQLLRLQTLTVELPHEAHFVAMPSGPLYLFVVGDQGNITRLVQKGIHRFMYEGLYHAPGRQEVDVLVCVEKGEVSIKMALAESSCQQETCSGPMQDAELLEANFRPGPPVMGPRGIH